MGNVHMLTLMLLVDVVAQLAIGLISSCGCLMHIDCRFSGFSNVHA